MKAWVLLLGLALGCSSGGEGDVDGGEEGAAGSCTSAPEACPSPVPSYATDIAPILEQSCTACHSPGGIAGSSETTYPEVSEQAIDMLNQVASCMMPPNTHPMTESQRKALLSWLVCGAPDN